MHGISRLGFNSPLHAFIQQDQDQDQDQDQNQDQDQDQDQDQEYMDLYQDQDQDQIHDLGQIFRPRLHLGLTLRRSSS